MSEENIGLAAQCWCDEETENFVMIPELALAFAKRLDEKDERIAELDELVDMIVNSESADKVFIPAFYKIFLQRAKQLKEVQSE